MSKRDDASMKLMERISTAVAATADLATIAADKAKIALVDSLKSSAELSAHERVCTERYGNIDNKLNAMDARLNSISNRMWAAAIGSLSMAAIGGGGLLFYLLTHGKL